MKIGICLPSYNEKENIVSLIKAIQKIDFFGNQIDIVLIDDNSPDGTYHEVYNEFKSNEKVFLIKREKNGRGGAVWDGLKLLKSKNIYDIYVEMDCDFSHSINDLEKGLKLFSQNNYDVLLGSRYPDGIIENWPLKRRMLSYISNLIIRMCISNDIKDYTNGFRFYNHKSVELILSKKPENLGFIYLSETLSFFVKNKFIISSFPIYFKNRLRGDSNVNINEIISSLKGLWSISKNFNK